MTTGAIEWPPPIASGLYRGTIQVVIQRCGSDPVGWRVSRHDIGRQRSAVALTSFAGPPRARTAHPGQAEPEPRAGRDVP